MCACACVLIIPRLMAVSDLFAFSASPIALPPSSSMLLNAAGKNGRNEMKRSPFAAFSLCITERLRSVTEVFVRNASAIAFPPSPQILLSVNGEKRKDYRKRRAYFVV